MLQDALLFDPIRDMTVSHPRRELLLHPDDEQRHIRQSNGQTTGLAMAALQPKKPAAVDRASLGNSVQATIYMA